MECWSTSSIESLESTPSRDDMGCMELSSSSCVEFGVPIDLRRVSQGIFEVAQRKSRHLSCMMGNGELL